MNQQQIERAIARLLNRQYIERYIEIMEMFHGVDEIRVNDVSASACFQEKYKSFYKMFWRSERWHQIYYQIFQAHRNDADITFACVLDELYNALNVEGLSACEYSFASKLVATINPDKPVLDQHILRNTSHIPPRQHVTIERRIEEAKLLYKCIQNWYVEFLQSKEGQLCVLLFNENVPNLYYNNADGQRVEFTDLKKVDFILWQHRMPDYRQMDCNH